MSHLSAPQLAAWFSSVYAAHGGRPAGIIFDCDGVLIDSREANIAYYDYLRRYVGLPPLPKEQHDFVQAGTVNEVLDVIIPRALRPLMREAVRKVSYLHDIMPHITHYPGLHGVLDLCKAADILMGIDQSHGRHGHTHGQLPPARIFRPHRAGRRRAPPQAGPGRRFVHCPRMGT